MVNEHLSLPRSVGTSRAWVREQFETMHKETVIGLKNTETEENKMSVFGVKVIEFGGKRERSITLCKNRIREAVRQVKREKIYTI